MKSCTVCHLSEGVPLQSEVIFLHPSHAQAKYPVSSLSKTCGTFMPCFVLNSPPMTGTLLVRL